jgi:hypothetical protein
MADSEYPLPSSAFNCLLSKLLVVLELTQKPEGATTTQAKQELFQAVSIEILSSRLRATDVGMLVYRQTTLRKHLVMPKSWQMLCQAENC